MFKRLSADKLGDLESGDRFARTAIIVYFLSFLLFPFFFFQYFGGEGTTSDAIWFGVVMTWLYSLKLAATMLIPALVCGALVFWVLYKITSNLVGPWLGAVFATPVAAYSSVLFSFHLNFDFFPPGLDWDGRPGSYAFSNHLGRFAAILSIPVSAITWMGVAKGE